MHTFTRYAAAIVFLSPALCTAQAVQAASWREVFEHGYGDIEVLGREEGINLHSPASFDRIYGRCEVGAPDSVVLIGRNRHSDDEYLPSFTGSYSRRQGTRAPLRPDSLRVRIAATLCDLTGDLNSLVLEHGGHYVHMDALRAVAPYRGMIWLFAPDSNGRLSELRWSPVLKRIEDVARARARWTASLWRQRAINYVLSGNIYVGMTPEMVREVLGDPRKINRTTTAHGTLEQWVYRTGYYVYVTNGRVTAIQD